VKQSNNLTCKNNVDYKSCTLFFVINLKMKKIIITLILIFWIFFWSNVYGYSIEEWEKTIVKLKKELETVGYIFKTTESWYYDWGDIKMKKSYDIFYKDELLYNLFVNKDWISLDYIKNSNEEYTSSSRIFHNKDYPLWHILYYFDKYKDKSKIINWVITKIELGHNNNIKVFPGKNKKYYLNIRYKWGDSQGFWYYNDNLYKKYYIKNKCYSLTEDKKKYLFSKEDRFKCVENSIIEHYIDSKITIKLKQSPSFVKLKKDEKWLYYFEIDLDNNDYDSIGKYWLEFELFQNWQKKWFNKKVIINVVKPVILIVWELWPDWWTIYNNWKDISISVKKWLLDKKYKISSLASEEWVYSIISSKEFSKTDDWMSISYYLDIKKPVYKLLYNNYLSWNSYWTTISNNLNNTDVKNYNKCILDKKKTDKEKYNCFKKYMWFSISNNKYDYSKSKLKCTKKWDENHNSWRTCVDIFFEEDNVPASNVIILSTDKEEIYTKFEKQLTISKLKLKKNPKFWKFISKFEKIVTKISDKKLLSIDEKIWKFSDKIRNNKKYKDILDYLEAIIKLEIIKRGL